MDEIAGAPCQLLLTCVFDRFCTGNAGGCGVGIRTNDLTLATEQIRMVPSEDSDRVEGVDFATIDEVLDDVSFPITADELIDQHGDVEIERTNADPITLAELFDFMGDDTFESADGVRQMVMSQMPRESVGPSNYSDRGGATPTETEAAEAAEEQSSSDLQDGSATDRDVDADGEHHDDDDYQTEDEADGDA